MKVVLSNWFSRIKYIKEDFLRFNFVDSKKRNTMSHSNFMETSRLLTILSTNHLLCCKTSIILIDPFMTYLDLPVYNCQN